jgi:hypothetical protein
MKCADGFCTKKVQVYCLYYKKVDRSVRRNTEHSKNDKAVRLIALWTRDTTNFQNSSYQFLLIHNSPYLFIAKIKLLFTGRIIATDILHRVTHSSCMQHDLLIARKVCFGKKYESSQLPFVFIQLHLWIKFFLKNLICSLPKVDSVLLELWNTKQFFSP